MLTFDDDFVTPGAPRPMPQSSKASVGNSAANPDGRTSRAVYGILGATGVIWSACYLLWMYQRVFFGKVRQPVNQSLPDLDIREQIALWPPAVAALVMGVAPLLWLNPIDPAVQFFGAKSEPGELVRALGRRIATDPFAIDDIDPAAVRRDGRRGR